ncbi:MAG: glucosamine-6-phosphate deaminase [Erysipelothrix sp.]|nr:glucosamine-6-phosphate deaminase [Erysipelothrix sp.]
MKFIKVKDYEAVSQLGFEIVEKQLASNKASVINFTTGDSPRGLILKLAKKINEGLDISQATFMNLDEFICPKEMNLSVYNFMHETLYNKIVKKPKNIFMLDGETTDVNEEIKAYKEKLEKYPADIQILGLGVNGHIGANEPGTSFDQEVFLSDSQPASIKRHMEQYDLTADQVPLQMITLGTKDIMKAKTVLLLVSGEAKAKAMYDLIYKGIDKAYPASVLKTHDNFICIYDEAAGSLI